MMTSLMIKACRLPPLFCIVDRPENKAIHNQVVCTVCGWNLKGQTLAVPADKLEHKTLQKQTL